MPYSISQSLEDQIHTSIASSLENFKTSSDDDVHPYIDCLVLHTPLPTLQENYAAWQTFETYVPHQIRTLGISNTSLEILTLLHAGAKIKPSVVQNRFYIDTLWEGPLRKSCRAEGIIFQSFWTLTANPRLLNSRVVASLVGELSGRGVEKQVALYCLVLGLGGLSVLDGTTKYERMISDLNGIRAVEKWAETEGSKTWQELMHEFRKLIGQDPQFADQ